MKKVITIHINGLLFHMEEDGFSMMRESLFRQGKQGDKATEAILAGKFSALINPDKQVITLADVQVVLTQTGFKTVFENTQSYNPSNNQNVEAEPRRLCRKTSDKVIGGVCSGLGEYWTIDPVILRIAFVVAFFGFGAGLLFYILLWIILPEKKSI